MAQPFGSDEVLNSNRIDFFSVNHLPIVKSFVDRLGTVDVINGNLELTVL